MMRMNVFFIGALILAGGAFQGAWASSDEVASISAKEALALRNSGKAVLVDAREWDEVAEGMAKDAVWLPLSGVQSDSAEARKTIGKLPKTLDILLYCRSGRRAGIEGALLQKQGFKVRNAGGFEALKAAGAPVATPSRRPE